MRSEAGITIRIDVLEVEGLSSFETPRFQRAVERELARLVAERGLSGDALQSRAHVAVQTDPVDGPQNHAARVAAAIYRALGQ